MKMDDKTGFRSYNKNTTFTKSYKGQDIVYHQRPIGIWDIEVFDYFRPNLLK